jgi:hypothetical protein
LAQRELPPSATRIQDENQDLPDPLLGSHYDELQTCHGSKQLALADSTIAEAERTYFDAIQVDLRNVAAQQTVFRSTHGRYAKDMAELSNFTPSQGVTISFAIDTAGYVATGQHAAMPATWTCTLNVRIDSVVPPTDCRR